MSAHEIDLVSLIEQFGSEGRCHEYLEQLRWPEVVRCPRCDSDRISRIEKRRQFDCDGCRYQFSVRVGTIFHDSKLPLWKWFLAIYMMGQSRKGVSANQLKRMLGVSYKTAWYLCHRIRFAMHDEDGELLTGVVEAGETYAGYKARILRDATHRAKSKIHASTAESARSLVDPSITGAYHKLSRKHLPAYLDEFSFRSNNRENPYLFRDTILCLVKADALTFAALVRPSVE